MAIVPELNKLSLRVLVIRGEADQYLPVDISKRLVAEIPNSKLVNIPTGGHFILEDEPELLSQTLHSFFQQNTRGN